MSDVPGTQPAPDPAPTPDVPPEPAERTVPYERFQQKNDEAKAAATELKKLQDRLSELEDQNKSETDRERGQRERAEQRANELQSQLEEREQRLATQERGSWVASAAAAANFADPQDAVALADLSSVESQRDAEKAVEKLAKSKPHLVRQETPGGQIGQVLQDGRAVQPGQNPQDARREGDQQFLDELKTALDRGQTSVPGLLDE